MDIVKLVPGAARRMLIVFIMCLPTFLSPSFGYSQEPPPTKPKANDLAEPAPKMSLADKQKLFKVEYAKLNAAVSAGRPYTEILPVISKLVNQEVESSGYLTERAAQYMELAFTMPYANKTRLTQYDQVQKIFFDAISKMEYYEKVQALTRFDDVVEQKVKDGFLYLGIQQFLKSLAIAEAKPAKLPPPDPDAVPLEPMRSSLIFKFRGRAANGLYFVGKADKAIALLNINLKEIDATPQASIDDRYFSNVLLIEPYIFAGQPQAALAAITRAEKVGTKIEGSPKYFLPIINYQKSNYYHAIGDFAKSDSFANIAIDLARKNGEPYHPAYGNRTKSQNLKTQKKYKEALVLALKAYDLYPEKNKLGAFVFIYEIASGYAALKDVTNWNIYYKKMLSLNNDGPIVFKELIAVNKAYVEGNIPEAKSALELAEKKLGKNYPQCLELRALLN